MKTLLLNLIVLILFSVPMYGQVEIITDTTHTITKQTALRIARQKRYYKKSGKWNTNVVLDTLENTWTIRSRKIKKFRRFRRGKGDGIRKDKIITIDAQSGRVISKKKHKAYFHYE